MAIWQDLVDRHSFAAGDQSVRRFIRKLHPEQAKARAVIETAPGEEARVDYGSGRTRLFVMTLGYSRKSVRLLSRNLVDVISVGIRASHRVARGLKF